MGSRPGTAPTTPTRLLKGLNSNNQIHLPSKPTYNQQNGAKTSYYTPLMKNGTIIQMLHNFNIQFDTNLLSQPELEDCIKLFDQLSFLLTGIGLDWCRELSRSWLVECASYPEIYVEGMAFILFSKHMALIMSKLGQNDFKLSDIIFPDPAILKGRLTFILNFIKFRELAMPTIEKVVGEFESIIKEYEQVDLQIQAEKEKVDDAKTRLSKVEEKKELYEKRILDHSRALEFLARTDKIDKVNRLNLKTAQDEATAKKEFILNKKKEIQDRITHLESLVVGDSTQFQKGVDGLKDMLDDKNDQLKAILENKEKLEQAHQIKKDGLDELKGVIQMLKDVKESHGRGLSLKRNISELQTSCQMTLNKIDEADKEITYKNDQIVAAKYKIAKFKISNEKKIESLAQRLISVQNRQLQLEGTLHDLEKQANVEEKVINEVVNKLINIVNQIDKDYKPVLTVKKSVIAKLHKIVDQFNPDKM